MENLCPNSLFLSLLDPRTLWDDWLTTMTSRLSTDFFSTLDEAAALQFVDFVLSNEGKFIDTHVYLHLSHARRWAIIMPKIALLLSTKFDHPKVHLFCAFVASLPRL